MKTEELNALWASLIIEELVRNGIDTFCISPGSRSTPLTLAAASNAGARTVVHFDERGMAFHALGQARGTCQPAALICTSGTAGANYLPAVAEASNAHVPLVILTADRPPELLDAGANQAMKQAGMFSNFVRWQTTLPCPCADIPPAVVLTTIDQAVYRARRAPCGPVHINCMFREPFLSEPSELTECRGVETWQASGKPYTSYAPPETAISPEARAQVLGHMGDAERGLLVVGQLASSGEAAAVERLAEVLNWPVCADIASGLRLGHEGPPWVTHYDALLGCDRFKERFRPDTVLHLGGAVTSKRLLQQLADVRPAAYIRVAKHPCRHDPSHQATLRIEAAIETFCDDIAQAVAPGPDGGWLGELLEASARAESAIDTIAERSSALNDMAISRIVAQYIPSEHILFLGNSMPIRDMDRAGDASGNPVFVAANRGVSGIDGCIATAAGLADATSRPVTALLGDLAFLHDLNSLALLRNLRAPLTLIVINNDGGGIFHHLSIAGAPHFEEFFAMPHGLDLSYAARLFDLRCYELGGIVTQEDFVAVYEEASQSGDSAIIEIVTGRADNAALQISLQDAISEALG